MLPKIDTPIFDIELPISKKVIKVKPFTVKEEKLLLFAQQSNSDKSIIESVMQVCNNCLVEDIDAMEGLGIYEVAPEDFALCEYGCTSKIETQKVVRKALDLVKQECG